MISSKRAVIISLAAALLFSAAALVKNLIPPQAPEIRARAVEVEEIMSGSESGTRKLFPGETLNINTASADELMSLPGIGEVLAAAIVDYRQENGDFAAVEDIMKVKGIGEKRFEALRDYITIED